MRRLHVIGLVALALAQLSCAAAGLAPARPGMPAARAALAPDLRVFYDALQDYGDWTLIEPYGYVFRPKVNFVAWRPYQDGFWVPTDVYGWVWISAEPFGWATYHYGRWLYDHFQGWVWVPGRDWGPAWVAWEEADDYVGWAPLFPRGASYGAIPGGTFTYVPLSQLTTTSIGLHAVQPDQIAEKLASARPVRNMVERDGVLINRGPKLEAVELATGPLPRVTLSDVSPALGPRPAGRTGESADALDATRRAAQAAADEARAIVRDGAAPPASVPVLRAIVVAPPASRPPAAERRAPGTGRAAPADTIR
jgi:hypothetical protein